MYNSEEEKCVLNAEMNHKLNNVILPHQQFLVPIGQQSCSFYLIGILDRYTISIPPVVETRFVFILLLIKIVEFKKRIW